MKSADHRGVGLSCPTPSFLKPHNLDLLTVLAAGVDRKWSRKTCQGKLAYVVHTLCFLRLTRGATPSDFVPISSRVLASVIGTRYAAEALRVLIASGVIETDRCHVPGFKSRGYRFTATYRTPTASTTPAPKVCRRDAKTRTRRIVQAVGEDPDHRFIFECLGALSFPPSVREQIATCLPTTETELLDLFIEDIQQRRFSFVVGRKTGRVTHTASLMPKALRRFVLLDGEPCAEVDLKSAQPLLLLSAYPSACLEKEFYAKAVTTGRLYELINERAGKSYGTSDEDRDRLKRAFLSQVLSGKRHYTGKLKAAFADLFPELARIVERAKQPDHAAITNRLMRLESELVVHRVVSRLRSDYPGLKTITIHDAILCAAKDAETIASVLKDETQRLLGVVPAVSITKHTT